MKYWDRRKSDELLRLAEVRESRQLARAYKKLQSELSFLLLDLYEQIANEEGVILASDLYKYNRYYDLLNKINERVSNLNKEEIDTIDESLKDLYMKNSSLISEDFSLPQNLPDNDALEKLVNRVWCRDGKAWSARIWSNTSKLAEVLETEVVGAITKGSSVQDVARTLRETLNVSYNSAVRLSRTELSYVQNQSRIDTFENAGIKKYKIVGAKDDRECSDACKKLEGKIFLVSEAKPGVNLPPIHPNCRCSAIPYIESED